MAGPGKPTHEEKMVLELSSIKASINNLTKAVKAHSDNTGKWLAIVAQAAASPVDNTAEVQKQVDALTAELNSSATAEEDALKQVQQPKEN